ncbi:MAG TPA: hypothetical protein VFB15_10180 [Candidatus Binataceae bacterium]|nr:hypothetical protein [Candidatus Binataceae bacterium]
MSTYDDTIDGINQAANQGYDMARDYADRGMSFMQDATRDLREFARREPWLALAASFAIGYMVAKMMRRVSS